MNQPLHESHRYRYSCAALGETFRPLGAVTDKFTQAINSHGAGLYRVQPQN